MSGQTLNDLIAAVFLRASDPPPPPAPQQFDPRAPESSTAASSSSSASSPSTDPAEATLSLLNRAQQVSDSIGVVSFNDALRDISTSSLRTLFLPSLAAELHSAVRTGTDHTARKQRLRSSQQAAAKFLNRVLALGVVPPTTKQLLAWTWANVTPDELAAIGLDSNAVGAQGGMPHAREVKISVFKLERALKANLEQFRAAYQAKKKLTDIKAPSDVFYDLLLYPNARSGSDDDDEAEADDDDDDPSNGDTELSATTAPGGIASARHYLLAQLNLHTLRAAQLVASASQELELLCSMPPPPPPSTSTTTSAEEWRLDRSASTLPTSGPLMAPSGKVLRPFTITASNRADVAASVFRPSYRLPTMSIDEYLEEEQRRGNIIQGGGQASYDAPTSGEQRALRMEHDGTRDADAAEHEQRAQDMHWDRFTEENKRGAGNTMNRG
ncbi:related to TAP42-component of the Tor signaling pathway [Sporisorium reilianum f. sp. reilianum]|uniref:Related to TAP42-component of the Tor signaling pathway n=1 Tax=Sporisorium reilianum f. sp. reilianum TaxID=72559 RepID=A0A2N8UN71_9BASI|nr:related to TAP42-component of the Tor signaling pathway [Sporisorium reilianum f. sp. reilianum]